MARTLEQLKKDIEYLVEDMGGSNFWANMGADEKKLHDFVQEVWDTAQYEEAKKHNQEV